MKTIIFSVFILIFVSMQTCSQQVKIIDPINLLASGTEGYQMPKISPDGKKVAFGGKGNNGIFITDYFGDELKQLTNYAMVIIPMFVHRLNMIKYIRNCFPK